MIVTKPHVGDVVPALIVGDFRRGEVVVIIDDGLMRGNLMIEAAGGVVVEQEIFVDIGHDGGIPTEMCEKGKAESGQASR